MEDKLTKEEVLHVAHLARIGVSEEEIEKYQVSLKKMINEIDKIKDIDEGNNSFLITPTNNECPLENKNINIPNNDLLKNVPKKKGNFVEVPVMMNE